MNTSWNASNSQQRQTKALLQGAVWQLGQRIQLQMKLFLKYFLFQNLTSSYHILKTHICKFTSNKNVVKTSDNSYDSCNSSDLCMKEWNYFSQ